MNGTRTVEDRPGTAAPGGHRVLRGQGHGSNTRYRNGCRCADCRTAANEHNRQARQAKQGLPDGDPRHGTQNGYSHHSCRCERCLAAGRAYSRAKYRRLHPVSGGAS